MPADSGALEPDVLLHISSPEGGHTSKAGRCGSIGARMLPAVESYRIDQ